MNDEAYAKFLEHSKTTHAMGRPGQVRLALLITFLFYFMNFNDFLTFLGDGNR